MCGAIGFLWAGQLVSGQLLGFPVGARLKKATKNFVRSALMAAAAAVLLACQGWPWIGLHGKEGLHGAAAAGKTLAGLDELHIATSSYNWTVRGNISGRAGAHVGYGEFLSLSDDGHTMATGAGYPAVSGYIQVFRWQDASVNASWTGPSAWVQLGNDINGTHVHLSKNGLVIAIGRRGADDRGRMTMYQWNQAQFEWGQMGNHIEGLDMLAESGRRSGEVAIRSLTPSRSRRLTLTLTLALTLTRWPSAVLATW